MCVCVCVRARACVCMFLAFSLCLVRTGMFLAFSICLSLFLYSLCICIFTPLSLRLCFSLSPLPNHEHITRVLPVPLSWQILSDDSLYAGASFQETRAKAVVHACIVRNASAEAAGILPSILSRKSSQGSFACLHCAQ